MRTWTIDALGDRAWLITSRHHGETSAGTMARWARNLLQGAGEWFLEAVPAYDTLTIHIEPEMLSFQAIGEDGQWALDRIAEELMPMLEGLNAANENRVEERIRVVNLPVVYGGKEGPDLAEAAARCGLTPEQAVERHAGADYEVALIGFAPGFPYLSGLPAELSQPRRTDPRKEVPAGSVGIAGSQTGVYPVASPGGWQLIGRTPLDLFRPWAAEPFLLRAGDRVKFVPITSEEAEVLRLTERRERDEEVLREGVDRRGEAEHNTWGSLSLTVLDSGLFTTVQAGPRKGWQTYGVSLGGAMDEVACALANVLVANAPDDPALELTLTGGRYLVEASCLAAVTGADLNARLDGLPLPMGQPVLLPKDSVLTFGRAVRGCRAYLAIAGGFAANRVLGSRSTDTRAGIGGLDGRALRKGDRLYTQPPSASASRLLERNVQESTSLEGPVLIQQGPRDGYVSSETIRVYGPIVLRVLDGCDANYFDRDAQRDWHSQSYRVGTASDRMGIRLSGMPLQPVIREEKTSHGVTPGTIQVPPDGMPIILAAGCQPTGGYPIVAHVASVDLPLLGQLRPGDEVKFKPITAAEALQALQKRKQDERIRRAGIRLVWYT